MTESSAAAAIQTTLSLPTLRQGQGPPGAVSRLQHIFNDFANADNNPRIFDESGVFGPRPTMRSGSSSTTTAFSSTGSWARTPVGNRSGPPR
jgi:hypothetical protein